MAENARQEPTSHRLCDDRSLALRLGLGHVALLGLSCLLPPEARGWGTPRYRYASGRMMMIFLIVAGLGMTMMEPRLTVGFITILDTKAAFLQRLMG